jgi:hypothetical protein
MDLERIMKQELSENMFKIESTLKENHNVETLRKLISSDKNAINLIFSKPELLKLVINPGLGKTVGHELVHLSLNTSFMAMKKPEIWGITDKSGWSIGHEAARSHIEVSKKLLEDNYTQLLSIEDNSGLSIGKAIYAAHKPHLAEAELSKLESWLKSSTNKRATIKEAARSDPVPITTPNKTEVINLTNSDVIKNIKNEGNTSDTTSNTNIKINNNESERNEILTELNKLIQKGGVNEVRKVISDDKIFASYLVSNNIGLDMVITPKGRKVAHYIAALYPLLAIKLISNPETVNISIDNNLWSVCHEAVFYHKEAAKYAMDSSSDLWGISDIDGKSVGHVAVKQHEDIAMLALAHTDSKKLLSVEDDHKRTVAHIGLYWSRFSLGVLEDSELYTLKDDSNKPLILEAVRLHKSSAAKVQRYPTKYLSNLEESEGKELLHILKAQLTPHK